MDIKKPDIKYRKNRVTAGVLCLFIILMFFCPAAAEADEPEQKTVRVGYVNVATYEEGGEGEYKRGSGYEYLQKISYQTICGPDGRHHFGTEREKQGNYFYRGASSGID